MEECKHHKEFVGEIRQLHLEIKDRLARIETKQDNASSLSDRFHADFSELYATAGEHAKNIAALNNEIKNLKWAAGIVAGIVAGAAELFLFIMKGGK